MVPVSVRQEACVAVTHLIQTHNMLQRYFVLHELLCFHVKLSQCAFDWPCLCYEGLCE